MADEQGDAPRRHQQPARRAVPTRGAGTPAKTGEPASSASPEPALLNDGRCEGPVNDSVRAAMATSLQRSFGNRAVQHLVQNQEAGQRAGARASLPVQRALGGLLGHGTSVADALKSKDPGDVKDVWLEDIKMASYDDRIALIRILAYQGWVGPRDRSKLAEIWGTFPAAQLVSTVSKEIVLWNHCVEAASGIADLPAVTDIAKDFGKDITTKAQYFLGQNRTAITNEMTRFGMLPTAGEMGTIAPAAASEQQKAQLKEIQSAAQLVKRYQDRLKEMSQVRVGKGFLPFDPNNKPIDDFLVGSDLAGLYGQDKQNEKPGYSANNAPNSTPVPNKSVDPASAAGKKGTWELVKEQWDFVNGRISSIANAFPTIFSALVSGTVSIDDLATTDPNKDPKTAATALHTVQLVMNAAYRNVETATKKMDGVTNPLDLRPVYEQLFGGLTVGGGSGRDWTDPLNQWVGRREVKSHKQIEAYIALGLEAAEFAVFVASMVFTGGGAAAFLALSGAGIGIPGAKAALSEQKYDSLASANKGQVRGDLAIVDKKDVDLAKMQAEQDAMAFKVAVMMTFVNGIAHGLTEAGALKAAKESGAGPGEPGAKVSGEAPGAEPNSVDGCFVAGTLVATPDGNREIEKLKPGDLVYAHDPEAEVTALHRVSNVFVHCVPVVLDIRAGRVSFVCSPPHPFWVPGAGWRTAGELDDGDLLLLRGGDTVAISAIEQRCGDFTVYNIEVEGLHTYFVSDAGVLVHNKAESGRLGGRIPALRGRIRQWNQLLEGRQGPKFDKLRATAEKYQRDLDLVDRSYAKAEDKANDPELKRLGDELKKLEKSFAKFEIEIGKEGTSQGGVQFFPEEYYLTDGKHGIGWTEGPAQAISTGVPQGQFGQPSDVDLGVRIAAQNVATLPADGAVFPIPGQHTMVVHMPNGTTVRANNLYVKVYPETVPGQRKVHMSPRP